MANIIDLSQIISANIYMGDAHECSKNPSEQSKNMIKHSIFNSVRANHMLHKNNYGNLILACDSSDGYWRKDVFPFYKCQRSANKLLDTSGINWEFVSAVKEEIINDLRTYFPYPVIQVSKAEGDDVIGTLVPYINENSQVEENIFGEKEAQPILITSSDKDNFQLHEYKNVRQFSPQEKKQIKPVGKPRNALIEKIVKGESGPTSDSIPNIRMHDSVFVDKIRQKPISQKFLDSFFAASNPIDACTNDDERKNYARNEQLVSYSKIPVAIRQSIIMCYNEQLEKKHNKMAFMNYLTQNRMSNILSNIHDFY